MSVQIIGQPEGQLLATNERMRTWRMAQQESIPVGCVPPTSQVPAGGWEDPLTMYADSLPLDADSLPLDADPPPLDTDPLPPICRLLPPGYRLPPRQCDL